MNTHIDIVCACDPGVTGGLCFLIGNSPVVFDPPVVQKKKTPTSKLRKEFDLEKMRDMFKPFADQDVVFGIEAVRTRPGESPIASFSFGEGYAAWKACAVCFNFKVLEISPMKWKKAYPELTTSDDIDSFRDEIKALRSQLKAVTTKTLKKDINKEIDTTSRKLKSLTKDAARQLAKDLFPDIADRFKLKKHDGRAEAVLLALFLKDHYSELV